MRRRSREWRVEAGRVDDRPLRLFVAGAVTGLPEVVLVPGLGAPGYLAPWVNRIGRWTRATVLDLPGWRWGRARTCPATLAGVSEATARWLVEQDRRDVVLIGHSTGAQAALRTALLVPDRLAGLVLAGPTFDPAARTVGRLLGRAASTLIHERPAELPAVLPSYLHGGPGVLRFLFHALPDRLEERAGQLRVPVLVMTGQRDGFAPPKWAHRLAELAGGRCTVLPGAHNACFPYPELADAALREAVLDWQRPSPAAGAAGVSATR
jgi:pimeloyl-ACP methyl ester carboxylesterase